MVTGMAVGMEASLARLLALAVMHFAQGDSRYAAVPDLGSVIVYVQC